MDRFTLMFGFLNALLLVLGQIGIGILIIKFISRFTSTNFAKIFTGLEVLLGTIFLSISISWASLLNLGPVVYGFFSAALGIVGIYTLIKILREFKNYNFYLIDLKSVPKIELFFLVALPLLFVFANSGDITNADSIDYHIGYALNYLQPVFDSHPEWYNGRMASIGEKINAIGLAAGSPQFGPLLQISGYISMGVLLAKLLCQKANNKYLLILALWSSPVFLFLGISAKPQLLPTALSCLSFYLVFNLYKATNFSPLEAKVAVLISLLLSSVSFTHKFSFIISYFFICVFLLGSFKKIKVGKTYCIFVIAIVSLLVITPAYLDKYLRYGSSVFEYFLNPVSSSSSSLIYFIETARHYRENHFPFPIYLFLPDSLGTISTVLGVGVIYASIPIFKNGITTTFLRILLALNIGLLAFFSMPSSRFFLEPYVWLLIIFGASGFVLSATFNKYIKVFVYLQALVVLVAISPISFYAFGEIFGFGVNAYKEKFVHGYNLQKWYSRVLPPRASILLDHRSISLSDRGVVSFEVHDFAKKDLGAYKILLSQLKRYEVHYVVTVDRSPSFTEIEKCSKSRSFGPENIRISTRNPFNSGNENAYIYSIDPENFVECLMLKKEGEAELAIAK
jgi:hypothetical protein